MYVRMSRDTGVKGSSSLSQLPLLITAMNPLLRHSLYSMHAALGVTGLVIAVRICMCACRETRVRRAVGSQKLCPILGQRCNPRNKPGLGSRVSISRVRDQTKPNQSSGISQTRVSSGQKQPKSLVSYTVLISCRRLPATLQVWFG
jgi:hypothetical protein